MTYQIKRFYQDCPERNGRVIRYVPTEEDAQEWCQDPETSSRTATTQGSLAHTAAYGPWFDGYEETVTPSPCPSPPSP